MFDNCYIVKLHCNRDSGEKYLIELRSNTNLILDEHQLREKGLKNNFVITFYLRNCSYSFFVVYFLLVKYSRK